MARKTFTFNQFAQQELAEKQLQQTKGGYKHITGIPGGTGSTGLIDWGEIEVRVYNLVQHSGLSTISSGKSKSGK